MSRWVHAFACVLLVVGCSSPSTLRVVSSDFQDLDQNPRDAFFHIVLKSGDIYESGNVEFKEVSLVIVEPLDKTHATVTFPLEIAYDDIKKIEIRKNDRATPVVVALIVAAAIVLAYFAAQSLRGLGDSR